MQSLRTRLFINSLIIIVIGMGLAGLLFWRAAESLYLETQTENLLAQARITAASLTGLPLATGVSEPYLQTMNAVPGIHTRILSGQGAVTISLPMSAGENIPLPAAENAAPIPQEELLKRPEITSALQGTEASAIRKVTSVQQRILYAAAPIIDEAGQITGLVYLAMPLPKSGVPADFIRKVGVAGLAAIGLALLAGTYLARRIAAPMTEINRGAQAVSAGDLQQQIQVPGNIREYHELERVFNRMVLNLKQSDQAKDAFVADVAHELRTPLTVIKGTIETLEDGAMDDHEGRGPLLSAMQNETERLIRLVNDLLVLTRAGSGMLKLDLKAVALAESVQRRCDLLETLARDRQIVFSVEQKKHVLVFADQDRLAQILDNLLENALRYTPENGMIRIMITQANRQACCAVHNDGPAIPAEHLPFVFERFYRVEASRNRQSGGAGLGLAIAKALVEAMRGGIVVESDMASGTTFRFWLPLPPN